MSCRHLRDHRATMHADDFIVFYVASKVLVITVVGLENDGVGEYSDI